MWAIWPRRYTAARVSAKSTRKKEETEAMARRQLTLEQQLKGIKTAIRSKRTPPQLREGLRKRAKWLKEEIRRTQLKRKEEKSFWDFD